jgi:LCP family protein required for cell wall assembly
VRPLRIVLIAVLAYLVWLLGLSIYAGRSIQHVDAMPSDRIADTSGRVWLLVGSDSREGLTQEEQSALHTGSEVGQRTDTIMLLHMKGGEEPTLVSVPRDSWVTIPAHTATDGTQVAARSAKINAAFSFGGAPLLIQTIEHNTGLHVDNYMEIGFAGIVTLTDAVSGIEVCFDKAINDEKSGLKVKKGCHTLDGEQALAWVRMRYSDPKGDLGRIERQQQYVAKVIDEIADWRTLVNPFRQVALVNAATDAFVVDQDSGVVDLGRLGMGMAKVSGGSAEVTTVPTSDTDHWVNGQWVLKWDPQEANQLFGSLGASTPPAQG